MYYFVSIVCGALILAGLVAVGKGLRIIYQARESASWVATDGQITHSQVVSKSAGDSTSYTPEVQYSYRVKDEEYIGTRIFHGDEGYSSNGDYARRNVERYPVGRKVSVYYDLQKPSSAVLEPGVSKKSYFPLVLGLGFVLFAAWFYLLFWLMEA
jgi:hypothetical protein